MSGHVTLLGSGSSMGVPQIGCLCAVCTSGISRLRPSLYVEESENLPLIVDLSPDFRAQALAHSLKKVGAIILTHAHFDHVAGLPDLRPFFWNLKGPLPIFAGFETIERCKLDFDYFLEQNPIDFRLLNGARGEVDEKGIFFSWCRYYQGEIPVIGLRFGDLAYLTDIKSYDTPLIMDFIKGARTLMISCQMHKKNHISLEEALFIAKEAHIPKVYLTHLDHHFSQSLELPPSIELAFDGMKIGFIR